jgi:hypothetical protein
MALQRRLAAAVAADPRLHELAGDAFRRAAAPWGVAAAASLGEAAEACSRAPRPRRLWRNRWVGPYSFVPAAGLFGAHGAPASRTHNTHACTSIRRSYLRSYAVHPAHLKPIFRVKALHLGHVAAGLGLREQPSAIGGSGAAKERKRRKAEARHEEAARRKKKMRSGAAAAAAGAR